MKMLEYLFFKYHNFQVKVSNGDIAPLMAVLFICLVIEFYYLSILAFYSYFVNFERPSFFTNKYSIVLVYVVTFIVFYFLFLHKKKYKKIIKTHEAEWKGKKNLGAILFAVLPFIIFFVETYIKMKMNQGAI